MIYTTSNRYGIAGTTKHRTAKAACKARDKREGNGWVVTDEDGYYYDMYQGIVERFSGF